jgi:hypothetical protein
VLDGMRLVPTLLPLYALDPDRDISVGYVGGAFLETTRRTLNDHIHTLFCRLNVSCVG